MHLRRTATTMTLALALAGGTAACNSEDAGRAVDQGAEEAKDAGKKAVDSAKEAGRKAADEADKAVNDGN